MSARQKMQHLVRKCNIMAENVIKVENVIKFENATSTEGRKCYFQVENAIKVENAALRKKMSSR